MMHRLPALLIGLVLLAACGSVPAAAPASVPAARVHASASVLPSVTALAQIQVVAETAATRTIKHSLGETTIPANATRVLVADLLTLGAYAALGELPYAACGYPLEENVGPFGPIMTPLLDRKTEHLGGCAAFSNAFPLERFATLDPELILVADVYAKRDNNYERLAAIAPTVAIPFLSSQRLAFFQNVAATIGKQQAAQELLDAHYAKLDAVKNRLAEPLDVAVVALYPEGLTIFADTFAINPSLVRMGLTFNPVVQEIPGFEGDRVANLSYEQLQLLQPADLIIVDQPADGTDQRSFAEAKLNDPLWQALPAVQQGNIVFMPESDLYATGSILSYERAADTVAAFLEQRGLLAAATATRRLGF